VPLGSVAENREVLKWNGRNQFLVFANGIGILGDNIYSKEKRKSVLFTSIEVGLKIIFLKKPNIY